MKNITLLLLIIPLLAFSQKSELSIFDNLVGKTWAAEGNWGDGSKFKQEVRFRFGLNKTLVIANSKGFVDKEQTKIGMRNHGIRQFDKASNTINFWEYDVFGGRTEGTVYAEGKNIIYQYSYGETVVTDMWEYVDDTTYNFIVGSYANGKWQQTFLKTQFKRID